MNFEITKHDNLSVISVNDKRLDAEIAVTFKNTVVSHIDEGNFLIVIDLDKVEFIDSSGLGAIVTCLKHLGRRGDIVISGVKKSVMPLFELTRMDKVFKIFTDTNSALEELRK